VAPFDKVSLGKAKVACRQIFDNAEECNKVEPFVIGKNEENLDSLENELKNNRAS
jgi:hypothetical protein